MGRKKELLREYLSLVLLENGNNPYTSSGSGSLKFFSEPLLDLLKGSGEIFEKSIPITKLALGVTLGVMKNMVPGLRADFRNTFTRYNSEINRINSKYESSLFKSFEDKDIAAAAFLWNPVAFVTGMAAVKSLNLPSEIISKVSDGAGVASDKVGSLFADDVSLSRKYREKIIGDFEKNVDGITKLRINVDEVLEKMRERRDLSDEQVSELEGSLHSFSKKLKGNIKGKLLEKYRDDLLDQRERFIKVLRKANVDVKEHDIVPQIDELVKKIDDLSLNNDN